MDQDSSIVPAELFDSCFLYGGKQLIIVSVRFPPITKTGILPRDEKKK